MRTCEKSFREKHRRHPSYKRAQLDKKRQKVQIPLYWCCCGWVAHKPFPHARTNGSCPKTKVREAARQALGLPILSPRGERLTNYVDIISGVLAPVLLISGAGLLSLSIQSRYGRVIDRIREFGTEMRENHPECCSDEIRKKRKKSVAVQTEILLKRGRYLRNSLFSLYLAVLFASLTSFLILLSFFMDIKGTEITFLSIGLGSLVIGMAYAIEDVALSYKAVELEIKLEELL